MRSNRATLSSPVTHNEKHRSLGRGPTGVGRPGADERLTGDAGCCPVPSLATQQQPHETHDKRAPSHSQATETHMAHLLFTHPLKGIRAPLFAVLPSLFVLFGGLAIAAQDKYTLRIPDGLAFADFRGYENWEAVAVSQTEAAIKVILANPIMMTAFRNGLPAEGKLFPDGSKSSRFFGPSKRTRCHPIPSTCPTP